MKSKLLKVLSVCILSVAAFTACAFAGCSDSDNGGTDNPGGTYNPGGTDNPGQTHQHEYVSHAEVKADCSKGGNDAYYTCKGCNLIFDANKRQISAIPETPKTNVHVPGAEWHLDGDFHWHYCTVCDNQVDKDDHTAADEYVYNGEGGHYTVCEVCENTIPDTEVDCTFALTVSQQPAKTNYVEGETFKSDGLKLKKYCTVCGHEEAEITTGFTVAYAAAGQTNFAAGDRKVTVTYDSLSVDVDIFVFTETRITSLTIADINCGETPQPQIAANIGDDLATQVVNYSYAKVDSLDILNNSSELEAIIWTDLETNSFVGVNFAVVSGGESAHYVVKASIAASAGQYTAATKYAGFSVTHNHGWEENSDGTAYEYKCSCGDVEKSIAKTVNGIPAQLAINNWNEDTETRTEITALQLPGLSIPATATNIVVKHGTEVLSDATYSGGVLTIPADTVKSLVGKAAAKFSISFKLDGVDMTLSAAVNTEVVTEIITTFKQLNTAFTIKVVGNVHNVIEGVYILGKDIDCGGSAITGHARSWNNGVSGEHGFRGTFDGRGKTISNLKMSQHGIFCLIGRGAIITNVNFTGVKYPSSGAATIFAEWVIGGYSGMTFSNINITIPADQNADNLPATPGNGGVGVITGSYGGNILKFDNITVTHQDASGNNLPIGCIFGGSGNAYAQYKDVTINADVRYWWYRNDSVVPSSTTLSGVNYNHTVHVYVTVEADEDSHHNVCKYCGAVEADSEETHNLTYTLGSSDHVGTCTVCGYSTGEVACQADTDWHSDATNHWHECVCGREMEKTAHTLGDETYSADGRHYVECSVCGKENYANCTYVLRHGTGSNVKEEYNSGDAFDTTGLILIKVCSGCAHQDGADITSDFTVEYQQGSTILSGDNKVTVKVGGLAIDIPIVCGTPSITGLACADIHCGATPNPSANPIPNQVIFYLYQEGEHTDGNGTFSAISDFTQEVGTYTVKAYVEGVADIEPVYATFGVTHSYANTVGTVKDVVSCDCGDSYDFVTLTTGRPDIVFQEKGGWNTPGELCTGLTISLNGAGTLASITSVTCGDYDFGTDLVLDHSATTFDALRAHEEDHGIKSFTVVGLDANGISHTVNVPVTLVTREFANNGTLYYHFAADPAVTANTEFKGYYTLTTVIDHACNWGVKGKFMGTLDGRGNSIFMKQLWNNGFFGANGLGNNGSGSWESHATVKNLVIDLTYDNAAAVKADASSIWSIFGPVAYYATLENIVINYTGGVGSNDVAFGTASYLKGLLFSRNVTYCTFKNVHINALGKDLGIVVAGNNTGNNTFENFNVYADSVAAFHTTNNTNDPENRSNFIQPSAVAGVTFSTTYTGRQMNNANVGQPTSNWVNLPLGEGVTVTDVWFSTYYRNGANIGGSKIDCKPTIGQYATFGVYVGSCTVGNFYPVYYSLSDGTSGIIYFQRIAEA